MIRQIYSTDDKVKYLEERLKSQVFQIVDLRKRVKELEQKDSYYPTKEEIRTIKIGGTD